jgi:hypothetical protein
VITPSFGLTATERVLPKLTLDFTTANLDPRVTFTRTTSASNPATYVDSFGYITAATDNQPRFDYNPVTLACKGLLIEESRSNLCLQSQNFATTWILTSITVPASSLTSPANDLTAFKYTPNNGATISNTILRQDFTKAASATTYTLSVYAKQDGFNRVSLLVRDGATSANFATVIISLVNGSVVTAANAGGTFTSASSTVTNAGNSWYRVTLTYTSGTETNYRVYLSCRDSSATIGDGTKGISMWGAQLEVAAFATSYIPTTTTALTRNADVATMTGSNFSDWWYATEGSVAIQATPIAITGTNPTIQFDDTTANELITLRGVAADPQLFIVDGGATQGTLDAGTLSANTLYNLSGAWKDSSFATAVNGNAAVSQASGTIPTVTQTRLGSDGTNYLNGHLQTIRYWPQRIINAETQAFSK